MKMKVIASFTPTLSNDPNCPMYDQYCKLSLVCYRSWYSNYAYEDLSNKDIVEGWKTFASHMEQPPYHLMQEYWILRYEASELNREPIGDNLGIINGALDGAGGELGKGNGIYEAQLMLSIDATEQAEDSEENGEEMD